MTRGTGFLSGKLVFKAAAIEKGLALRKPFG
jgi:hypothetical protein